jgi:hypothetical protein
VENIKKDLIMKTQRYLMIILAGMLVFFLSGCEVGKYPLILDASGKSRTIHVVVNAPTSEYSDSAIISISDLRDLTDYDIDSIHFYNLTLNVDNNLSASDAAISGEVTVNGYNLLTLTNVMVTEFTDERSIFDKTIAGYGYDKSGVTFLLNTLKTQNPPEINVKMKLNSITKDLNFDLTITLYAQVFANP